MIPSTIAVAPLAILLGAAALLSAVGIPANAQDLKFPAQMSWTAYDTGSSGFNMAVAIGQVFNLEEDSIGAVIIGDDTKIKEGDSVRETGRIIEIPVGKAMLGRVVNAHGRPIDSLPRPWLPHRSPLDRERLGT